MDDSAIALTLRQLSEGSLSKLNNLLDTVDVIELEKDTKKEQIEKKGESKAEIFRTRILPRIRHSSNVYLSSPKLDDFSVYVQGYFVFSAKLGGGKLEGKNVDELSDYLDRVETNTQRFLSRVVADKRFIFRAIRQKSGAAFEIQLLYQSLRALGDLPYSIRLWPNNY